MIFKRLKVKTKIKAAQIVSLTDKFMSVTKSIMVALGPKSGS